MIRPTRVKACLIASLLASFLICSTAQAGMNYLGLGAGAAGVLDDRSVAFGVLEFRPAQKGHKFGTWMSLHVAEREHYFAAGLLFDWKLSKHLRLTPSFGVGLYSDNQGMELGSALEFRSGIELGYVFKNRWRLGAEFAHVSNGGIDSTNPGAELAMLTILLPVGQSR